jgi:hypothetical protein
MDLTSGSAPNGIMIYHLMPNTPLTHSGEGRFAAQDSPGEIDALAAFHHPRIDGLDHRRRDMGHAVTTGDSNFGPRWQSWLVMRQTVSHRNPGHVHRASISICAHDRRAGRGNCIDWRASAFNQTGCSLRLVASCRLGLLMLQVRVSLLVILA